MINTLLDLLQRFDDLGDREALVHFNGYKTEKFSYKELLGHIGAVHTLLKSKGISTGSRVAIAGNNCPEWVIAYWACLTLGAEVVPVDEAFSPSLIHRILLNTQTSLLISSSKAGSVFEETPVLYFDEISTLKKQVFKSVDLKPQDIVEIVFTSGTTGNPKGVIHRHQNICANLEPFRKEFNRYYRIARPFQPVRILNLLPLSHMFGQAMGLFIPVLLGGSVVFTPALDSGNLIKCIQKERISVLVCIPRFLLQFETFLRETTVKRISKHRLAGIPGILERWFRYRKIHTRLGLKFWAVVVGGAPLPPNLEDFWSRIGILLVQGYGMTEASPIVAVNHPFHTQSGAIGKILEGQELELSDSGEILIRGKNVQTEYLQADGSIVPVTQEGWLHTGDIGEFDDEGNLFYRGRKKEMIVTSEGHNVFPEDVETILNQVDGVKEAAVVGRETASGVEVHAILVLRDSEVETESIIKEVNQQLQSHQRIRSWTSRNQALPRTPSTQKLRRNQLTIELADSTTASLPTLEGAQSLEGLLSNITGFSTESFTDGAQLSSNLGLSSLDRVELMSSLEQMTGCRLNEDSFSETKTVGELRRLVKENTGSRKVGNIQSKGSKDESDFFPKWSTRVPFSTGRKLFQKTVMRPLFNHYMHLSVIGVGRLKGLNPPFLFAANHTSHLDVIAILAALPPELRARLAPAIRQEYFEGHFSPSKTTIGKRLYSSLQYYLACLLFNTFPLPQRTAGIRKTLKYAGQIASAGFCPLVFPEGRRTPDGSLQPFKPGIGLMAAKLELPVAPIYLKGLFEVFSVHDRWPHKGPVQVRFGAPQYLLGSKDASKITTRIENEIRVLERYRD